MSTWLIAIARNLLIDHYRSQPSSGPNVPIQDVNPSHLPSTAAEADLGLGPELTAALRTLADRERELLALRYGAELSGPEIAELTGLTLANVQQIISRSLKRLRTVMER